MPRLTRQETIVLLAVAGLLLLGLTAKYWRAAHGGPAPFAELADPER
jgi:hypothetical protein